MAHLGQGVLYHGLAIVGMSSWKNDVSVCLAVVNKCTPRLVYHWKAIKGYETS